MIPDLIDQYGIPSALAVAASYCDIEWGISADMAHVLIQSTIADANMHYAIWMFDEMINRNNDYKVNEDVFNWVANEILIQHEIDEVEIKELHSQLIKHIYTCSGSDFAAFVAFISEADTALILADETMLAVLERIRRYLNNDRVFFLALYSALISDELESVVSEINTRQLMTLSQLRSAGYQVKIISGTVNAFLVYPPNAADSPTDSPKEKATGSYSGTDWINSMTGRSRRHRR